MRPRSQQKNLHRAPPPSVPGDEWLGVSLRARHSESVAGYRRTRRETSCLFCW